MWLSKLQGLSILELCVNLIESTTKVRELEAYDSIEIPKYVDKVTPEYKPKFDALLVELKEAEQKSLKESERLASSNFFLSSGCFSKYSSAVMVLSFLLISWTSAISFSNRSDSLIVDKYKEAYDSIENPNR